LFEEIFLVVSFPFLFLPTGYPPTRLCKSFSPPLFYSTIYYDYQVLALALYGVTLRSFGREPVSRTEQRTECKFFFYIYIYSFLSFFFRVISFPTNNNFSLPVRQHKKEGCTSTLSSTEQSNNFFSEDTNDGSQHLRDMLPFFSSLFFIFISFFRYTLRVSLSTC
jgi:hypothetical protein